MKSDQAQEMYTLKEVAEILRVSPGWVYERSRRGTIPGQVKIGKHVRVSAEGLRVLMTEGLPEEVADE